MRSASTTTSRGLRRITVDELGNTASTTLFVALHELLDRRALHAGDQVLMINVASGLQVGVVVFEVDELEVTHGELH